MRRRRRHHLARRHLHLDITPDDAVGFDNHPPLPCTWTAHLNGGQWTMNESCTSDTGDGTYEMFRDRIVFTWFNGSELAFGYAVDSDGRHTLTPEAETPEGDAFVWATNPWERVND